MCPRLQGLGLSDVEVLKIKGINNDVRNKEGANQSQDGWDDAGVTSAFNEEYH